MRRDAPAERARIAIGIPDGFAGQLELDHLELLVGRPEARERHPQAADHAVNRRELGVELDECPHLDRPGAVLRVALFDERDGLRCRDRNYAPDPDLTDRADIAAVHDHLFFSADEAGRVTVIALVEGKLRLKLTRPPALRRARRDSQEGGVRRSCPYPPRCAARACRHVTRSAPWRSASQGRYPRSAGSNGPRPARKARAPFANGPVG